MEKTNIDINRVDVNGSFNINYRDEVSGDTVIHTAIKSDNYEGNIASLLKLANQMGFDPNIKNKYGKTVLDVALNSDCKYELDSDDIIEVKTLIKKQQEKIKLIKIKEKLLLIQEQVE